MSRFIWTTIIAKIKTVRKEKVATEREDEASIGRSPYSISPTDIPNVLKKEVMGALKKVKS